MGRYAAYTERTITVETGLAIALGDGAACRRLRKRVLLGFLKSGEMVAATPSRRAPIHQSGEMLNRVPRYECVLRRVAQSS